MLGTRIAGWGTSLPDKTVTNADLEARLDTTDEWIVERSGIRERRIGESTQQPLAYYRNNLLGLISTCEAMRESGCSRIVFSSSATV